jgi:S-DNA-T family DNA segregation ATPase FtsK/SpoIIIE
MLIYIAVVAALDKPLGSVSSKLIGTGILIILTGGAIHIFANEALYLQDEGIMTQLKNAWVAESFIKSGGVIGALFGGILAKLFGKTGAGITVTITLVIGLMLLTGMSLVNLYRAFIVPVKKVGTLADERMEQNLKRQELRRSRIEEKTEEPAYEEKTGKKGKKLPVIEVGPDATPQFNMEDSFPHDFISTEMPKDKLNTEIPVMPSAFGFFDKAAVENDLASEPVPIESILSGEEKEDGKKVLKKIVTVKENTENESASAENSIFIPAKNEEQKKKSYRLPPIECLNESSASGFSSDAEEIEINSIKLIDTLNSFGVKARILDVFRGPSVTRYELQPAEGVKISKITNLSDDIAMRLAATGVRIEAPIPGKAAIGIEIPNKSKSMVAMREIIDTPLFKNAKSKLNVALGKDITGNAVCADLSKMPHLLIAGTTGSGKSVCLNSMILSILYNATPDEVKLLMVDPKQVEFTVYNGIPHLLVPVVSDARKAAGALGWAVSEMLKRYNLFSEKNVRDITGYNHIAEKTDGMELMSRIVIFIDELSDLMMVAPNEVEDSICRLAQMARAAGMHLVIATQRPSVDVITGIIKANIPSRIALYVSSQIDSRTIIDMAGAEKLLGYGDMLFDPVGISKPVRIQGCFVSDAEVEKVVNFIKNQEDKADYDDNIMQEIERNADSTKKKGSTINTEDEGEEGTDSMFKKAVEVVVEAQMASTTLLQRRLKLGYARAARIVDELEEKGIVGPFEGSKPRKVLITKQQWMEMNALSNESVPSDDYVEEMTVE